MYWLFKPYNVLNFKDMNDISLSSNWLSLGSRFWFFFAFLIYSINNIYGQNSLTSDIKQAVIIQRLDQPVNFDGVPDEPAWNSISPFQMIMFSPVFGKEPTETTETRIAYDNDNLYVGVKLLCQDPSMIRSTSFKRDYTGGNCDWFMLILDTYNDKENAFVFATTPDALRWDANILKDANVDQDQSPFNRSWNSFWDVKTKVGNDGWTLEMRIPLSSLRFQEVNGEVKMGLINLRWIPAKNETDVYPAIPPNWGRVSFLKPSQAQEVILRDVKAVRPLYVAPYALAGYERRYELKGDNTSYQRIDKPAFEAGLDFKYGLSSNMILDLTVNTDFAQIEADDQQINLTRFSLYFPEKRTFFLERASIFDFTMGGTNNLFYSRRIGLSNYGDPIRIYGGARIIGRMGKWDIGLLDMQTAPLWKKSSMGVQEQVMPSENFGVLRIRRQVLNENSYIGIMLTNRIGVNGTFNTAYGIDGLIRLFGEDYLDLKLSQTFENGVKNHNASQPTKLMLTWERRSKKGLGYFLGYAQSGINYNPGIGFEMLDNYTVISGVLRYGWLPGESSKLYSHTILNDFVYRTNIDNGSLLTLTNTTSWSFQTKSQYSGSFNMAYNIENLRDTLKICESEVVVPPGRYKFISLKGSIVTPPSKSFYTMIMTDAGQYFDGMRISVHMEPTWNVSKHFEIGGTYNFDWVTFKTKNQEMVNHIAGIKVLYMLDTRLSFSAFVQYNTAVHGIISNFRFRYNPKEGTDLYLVYNEGRNTDLGREIPHLPAYNSRAVMVKYTYTFTYNMVKRSSAL